tara:strand:+ start:34491 stop:34820 length:330 start_codon:yes stop_codon:yes gene_type:complete
MHWRSSSAGRQSIIRFALPLDGTEAQDTFRAVANLAKTPWLNAVPIFNLVTANVYQAGLGSNAPSVWTLALLFKGDPTILAGPGLRCDGGVYRPGVAGQDSANRSPEQP